VTGFYEQHPYPPPTSDLTSYREAWQDSQCRRVEHFRLWPTPRYREDHAILVAGCGTSQAAKYAVRYPRARVVGIDLSEPSLEHNRRLARQHGLSNLELRVLPVEQVAHLDESFDQVVCTGVLHHLACPEEGLEALANVLTPAGAIHLMVYGRYGRTGISIIQEYARL
ncbi:MAG: class I SAM-dependent methyltransferase, partial [bacterium]|nr:class I SAM-dependent methyltransferase [bacterium]